LTLLWTLFKNAKTERMVMVVRTIVDTATMKRRAITWPEIVQEDVQLDTTIQVT